MFKDVTLLEEIAEQDLTQASGGITSVVQSQGWVCSATKECICFW